MVLHYALDTLIHTPTETQIQLLLWARNNWYGLRHGDIVHNDVGKGHFLFLLKGTKY